MIDFIGKLTATAFNNLSFLQAV